MLVYLLHRVLLKVLVLQNLSSLRVIQYLGDVLCLLIFGNQLLSDHEFPRLYNVYFVNCVSLFVQEVIFSAFKWHQKPREPHKLSVCELLEKRNFLDEVYFHHSSFVFDCIKSFVVFYL